MKDKKKRLGAILWLALLLLAGSLWIVCRSSGHVSVSEDISWIPKNESTELKAPQTQNQPDKSDSEIKRDETESDEPTKTAEDSSISGSSNTMEKEDHIEMPDSVETVPEQNEETSGKIPEESSKERSDVSETSSVLTEGVPAEDDQSGNSSPGDENAAEASEVPPSSAVHAHHFEITEEKESGCREEGFLIYTCGCGEFYKETIPSRGHDMGDETDLFGDGLTFRCRCLRCGAFVIRNAITTQEEYYWISWTDTEGNACYVTMNTYEACKAKEGELLSQHLPCNWGNGYKETITGWEYSYSPDY